MRTKLVILSLVVLCAPSISSAADLTRRLTPGATLAEVMDQWGEPTEKVEKGIKRQVVWYYPQGAKVVFKDGKVMSSGPDVPYVEPPAVPAPAGQPPLIPNQIPPGGRGAPAGIVPGGDVELDEE